MRGMHRRLVWSLALAGCAGAPAPLAPTTPPVLAPFAAASQFVPDGMVSFAFLRGWPIDPLVTGDAKFTVLAGREFHAPTGRGLGISRTIAIGDFGEHGLDTDRWLRERKLAAPTEMIGTQACWHQPPAGPSDLDAWYALVDDRFVISAHYRDVLGEALQRRGNLPTMLAPFGNLSFVPADAEALVFSLPRTDDVSPGGWLVPIELMVFAISPRLWHLAMFSHTAPPAEYQDIIALLLRATDGPVQQIGGWRCQTRSFEGPEHLREIPEAALVVWMLFGYRVLV